MTKRKFVSFINSIRFKKQNSISYSQEGEDLILQKFLYDCKKGFYVDIGAHHPVRFSNTYYFYLRGWKGINIDAMPGSMKAFDKIRKRDINLEIPISEKSEKLNYYVFNEPALNGFSKNISELRDNVNNYKILSEIELETKTLESVLDDYLPKGQHITFMSIDVEGLDFAVLKSSNWKKYKPDYILIEILDYAQKDIFDLNKSEITKFLYDKGYKICAKSFNTVFFKLG